MPLRKESLTPYKKESNGHQRTKKEKKENREGKSAFFCDTFKYSFQFETKLNQANYSFENVRKVIYNLLQIRRILLRVKQINILSQENNTWEKLVPSTKQVCSFTQ